MVNPQGLEVVLLFAFTTGFIRASELTEVSVRVGENVTLQCAHNGDKVMWVKEDRSERMSQWRIQADGSLSLPNVARDDTGIYTCAIEDEKEIVPEGESISASELNTDEALVRSKYRLIVKTPPGALVNVTVHPSTVLALLMWDLEDPGGCELFHFSARYRQTHTQDWKDVDPRHISPTVRQIDVYHLHPNSTYIFQVWAVNEVGPGEVVTIEATTKHVLAEIELARHLLEGVETFDTRIWVAAVAVVMGTLVVLSIGTCYLMFKDHHMTVWSSGDQEILELVPNIILNPGFRDESERLRVPDENCNDEPNIAFNNNTVVRPQAIRV